MADYRTIQSKIWRDEWFTEQPPDAKLLFVYLFTNPDATVAGIYLLPVKFMAFDTGISIERIKELLLGFTRAGKVEWCEPVVWVKKMREYQATPGPRVETRIQRDLWVIPEGHIKEHYLAHYKYHPETREQPDIGYPELSSETDTDTDKKQKQILSGADAPRAKKANPSRPAIVGLTGEQLLKKLRPHYEAVKRDPPKYYKNVEMQAAFEKVIPALGIEFDELTDRAFERGIDRLENLLAWYQGCLKKRANATNGAQDGGNQDGLFPKRKPVTGWS